MEGGRSLRDSFHPTPHSPLPTPHSSHLTSHTSYLIPVIILLLILGGLIALPLVALGLPGTWAYMAAVGLWKLTTESPQISWTVILTAFGLAALAEGVEWVLASRYTTKYGGSSRAGWGAIIGGIVGAIVGVPVPVIGSVIGSFAGAFVGALVGEYSVRREHMHAGRVAWGAVIGRGMAVAVKVGLMLAIMILLVVAAF